MVSYSSSVAGCRRWTGLSYMSHDLQLIHCTCKNNISVYIFILTMTQLVLGRDSVSRLVTYKDDK